MLFKHYSLLLLYVVQRQVLRDFKTWIQKRYSAFLSSVQQTAEVGMTLNYQDGGNLINSMTSERLGLKRVVYQIINSEFTSTYPVALKNHVKMLTALAEMTTATLINKVITQGGAVVVI